MGQIKSNLRLKMKFFALGRLKNHNVPHLHPYSTMFMPLDRLQFTIYAFSGKFNVCSVLISPQSLVPSKEGGGLVNNL